MNILAALLGMTAGIHGGSAIEHPLEYQPSYYPRSSSRPRRIPRRRFPKSVPAGYWQQQTPIEHMHSKARMRALNSAAV